MKRFVMKRPAASLPPPGAGTVARGEAWQGRRARAADRIPEAGEALSPRLCAFSPLEPGQGCQIRGCNGVCDVGPHPNVPPPTQMACSLRVRAQEREQMAIELAIARDQVKELHLAMHVTSQERSVSVELRSAAAMQLAASPAFVRPAQAAPKLPGSPCLSAGPPGSPLSESSRSSARSTAHSAPFVTEGEPMPLLMMNVTRQKASESGKRASTVPARHAGSAASRSVASTPKPPSSAARKGQAASASLEAPQRTKSMPVVSAGKGSEAAPASGSTAFVRSASYSQQAPPLVSGMASARSNSLSPVPLDEEASAPNLPKEIRPIPIAATNSFGSNDSLSPDVDSGRRKARCARPAPNGAVPPQEDENAPLASLRSR